MRKHYFLVLFFSVISFAVFPQNVGIGNPNPAERLDVNGNINLTGTIKANGVAGEANQVLKTNNSGNLEWGDLSDYKHYATFLSGSGTWGVPAGVTRVMVEAWGAGGGGSIYGGGAAGGYIRGIFQVTPGDGISWFVGVGGGGSASAPTNGSSSSVTHSGITLAANGGAGFAGAGTVATIPLPGNYSVTAGFSNFIGLAGAEGSVNTYQYFQPAAGTFYEVVHYGAGGTAANVAIPTGGAGSYRIFNNGAATQILHMIGSAGKRPGGGGGGGAFAGLNGGPGMVVIRY